MNFDEEYFNRLANHFNAKDDVVYNISDLTDDSAKLIFHVKYYIDHRTGDMVHVEFNNDFTRIKVYEFFDGKIKEFDAGKIPPWVWDAPAPRKPTPIVPAVVVNPAPKAKPVQMKAKELKEAQQKALNKTRNLFE